MKVVMRPGKMVLRRIKGLSQRQSLLGMAHLFLDQTRRWQAMEAVACAHCQRFGVEEIRMPLLEVTALC